ncbi:hypothetical protein [Nocardiopsis tropica]|uniref:Uncharacterized protein n=1 Tax=Nocardiopsis tropica TaxID=109330 RepID=A0ABU7KQV1_9ACTN|nr:hypothetical protein [Nocardiopsis umidischolae]MEE2051651.1 hypothetical protein [Nocardiopsis umidischolae]
MDLFGSKRRAKDLMILEKARHDLLDTNGPIVCSCGWTGVNVRGRSASWIEGYFASHIRVCKRGW